MALTATEEAQARQLIAQQAALLSLAGNEATITSKLGAAKVNLGQLPAASAFADADLLLTRQGTTDKSLTAALLAQYCSEEFLAGITTPPQFDNDTSVATTAFVQRALGNHSGNFSFTSSQSIGAAHAGGYIKFTLTSAQATATLSQTVPAGVVFTIANANSSAYKLTVSTAGGFDSGLAVNGVTTFDLQPNTQATFVSNGSGSYDIINGVSGSSLTNSGYQKLPSGLIIQWGVASIVGIAGSGFSYPIAFPNAVHSLVGVVDNPSSAGDVCTALNNSLTTGAFRLNNAVTRNVSWIAVGH